MVTQLQRYLTLDGIEAINGWRTRAYAGAGLIERWELAPCDDTTLLDGVPVPDPGTADNPVTDPAPWYDDLDEDSAHFFGIEVISFTSTTPLERVNLTQRRIGRLQTTLRRFTLDAFLLADSCCGTDYGRRWLLKLFQAGCGSGCATLSGVISTCERPDALRDVYGLGLVSFEDITPRGMSCCEGARIQVVFDAENPYLYGGSIGALVDGIWEGAGFSDDDCVPWDTCPEPTEVACGSPLAPTIAPPPLPSLSGPLAPGGVAVPWCNPSFEVSQCVALPTLPRFGEAVYRFTIVAGTDDVTNARLRVWNSADAASDADCETAGPAAFVTEDGPILPLAELRITYIPAGGTLVVDGSSKTIRLFCPDLGEWINADHLIYGPYSAFWQHPVIGCTAQDLCVCATADAETIATDATFSVEVIPRYL